MYSKQVREQAKALFQDATITRKEIARITGVSLRTLFDWEAADNWLRPLKRHTGKHVTNTTIIIIRN